MTGRRWRIAIVLVILAAVGIGGWRLPRYFVPRPVVTLRGAVLVRSDDVDKQVAIPSVEISAAGGLASQPAWSSPIGFFALTLARNVKPGQPIILRFRHPEYQPLDLPLLAGGRLEVASMIPIAESAPASPGGPPTIVSGIRIRYLTRKTTVLNVGSVVKTFRVVNTPNVPCRDRHPCSPDGKWKATLTSATIEASGGNVFSKGRVSCIAGPCPFTNVRFDSPSQGEGTLKVAALDWSSTTTFLIEAQVYHSMIADSVNYSYPVIFGPTLHFTVPADAEGLCIEADINGKPIVFPLGPEPILSWASCTENLSSDRSSLYQCELKPSYGFK